MPEVTFGRRLPISGRGVKQGVEWVGKASVSGEAEMGRDRGRPGWEGTKNSGQGFPELQPFPLRWEGEDSGPGHEGMSVNYTQDFLRK